MRFLRRECRFKFRFLSFFAQWSASLLAVVVCYYMNFWLIYLDTVLLTRITHGLFVSDVPAQLLQHLRVSADDVTGGVL